MKKILILLFLFFIIKGRAQTYSFYLSYSVPTQKYCWDGMYGWSIFGDGKVYKQQIKNKIHLVEYVEDEYFSVPNFSKFDLTIKSTCYSISGVSSCDGDRSQTITASAFIKSGSATLFSCQDERFAIDNFKPNVTIKNLNTTTPNEICAGEQLQLAAFPAGFPNEAYHWQYSTDNKTTWKDIPLVINGNQANDTPNNNIYLQQLLGTDHVNYINKPIYFRLGYGQTRNFTDPLEIKYLACAPIVDNIVYEQPKCKGDAVTKLDVIFNRPLNNSESLDRIKMKDVLTGAERNERTDVSTFTTTPPYTYSFTNLDALENGHTYKIVYQAQITDPLDTSKKILKGFLESSQTFTYNEPPVITFELEGDNPLCNNGQGSVIITAHGGSGEYFFYSLNGGESIRFQNPTSVTTSTVNGEIIETRLGSQLINLPTNITTIYNITVTDGSGCIEKTL